MNVASVAHVFDGPRNVTGGLTGSSHLAMETGVIEETLDDVAARMVQWAVVIGIAQHPACTRRWETRVAPPR
eukprot:1559608-Pyramimonas_sp.AAC.1